MGSAFERCLGDGDGAEASPARANRLRGGTPAGAASDPAAAEHPGGYFGLGLFPTAEEKRQRGKREINIKYKLREFVAKERQYIAHLGTVKRVWILPLRELERDPLVSAVVRADAARLAAVVFGNWENLLEMHLSHIAELELALLTTEGEASAGGACEADARFRVAAPVAGRGADCPPRADGSAWALGAARAAYIKSGTSFAAPLAEVFRTMGPYLKLYMPYCTLYATRAPDAAGGGGANVLAADLAIEEASARGGPLAVLLAEAAANAAPLQLASLRIAPVQHVCRYRLVLGDLHRKMRRHEGPFFNMSFVCSTILFLLNLLLFAQSILLFSRCAATKTPRRTTPCARRS